MNVRMQNYKTRKKALDQIFSKYIRLRDADSDGYCRCVTCGRFHHWKDMHCGHFVSRDRIAVRWDERNANAQCCHCNTFRAGEQHKHGQAIDAKHGKGTAEMLQNIGSARGAKVDLMWMELEIKKFKTKVKGLAGGRVKLNRN